MIKRICLAICLAVSMLTLYGCSSQSKSEPSADSIVLKIVDNIDSDTMVQLSEERIANYYDLDISDLLDYSIYVDGSGGFSDEVAVLKAKDSEHLDILKECVEKRVESQKKAFDGYNAGEYKKLEDYLLTSKDNYVLFVVSGDTDGAEKIFRDAFK